MNKIWMKEDIRAILDRVGEEFGLSCSHVEIIISSRMEKTMGSFVFLEKGGKVLPREFRFSTRLLCGEFPEEMVRNVLIHEYAHFYANVTTNVNNGHNAFFKSVCTRLEIPTDTLFKGNKSMVFPKKKGYVLTCTKCGENVAVRRRKDAAMEIRKKNISGCCEAKLDIEVDFF